MPPRSVAGRPGRAAFRGSRRAGREGRQAGSDPERFDDATGLWTGWNAVDGSVVTADLGDDFEPWQRAFNADDPPHWKWFEGGRTNACFNEVDRHVLAGFGSEAAFLFEGDRWDLSQAGGRGAPVAAQQLREAAAMLDLCRMRSACASRPTASRAPRIRRWRVNYSVVSQAAGKRHATAYSAPQGKAMSWRPIPRSTIRYACACLILSRSICFRLN
jgi:hypothetical protein